MLPASAAETEGECALAVVSCVVQAKLCLRKFILLLAFSQDTPLHESARNGHLEVCRLLLQSSADVEAKNNR
jgi:ankyrin repeat protein